MSGRPWFSGMLSRWRRLANDRPALPASDTESVVTRLWTCKGEFFGYRRDDFLFAYDGRQAGQFGEGDEIYDRYGSYTGEIRKGNRLVTNISKRDWSRPPFTPVSGARFRPSSDLNSIEVMPGFEDFPIARES